MEKCFYKNRDLALIIPTKDRPEKLRNLLISLTMQDVDCLIIIVDGGKSIKGVAQSFKGKLTIDYYKSDIPGQIHQRNIGISKLTPDIKLVGFIDDDIIFEKDSLKEMISFWNSVEEKTAGIGFNLITEPKKSYSLFTAFEQKQKGMILKSGFNTPITNISQNIRTQWLAGGITVWRKDIIFSFRQAPLKTKWAVGEDVRYSYPIGKSFPLYVCANAKVEEDDHAYLKSHPMAFYKYQGMKTTLAIFYFVTNHSELSKRSYLFFTMLKIIFKMTISLFSFSKQNIAYTWGQLISVAIIFKSLVGLTNILNELED